MMRELKVLGQLEVLGKELDYYDSVDEPLFLAKNIAEWIEHSKPRDMVANVDTDEKLKMGHMKY